MDYEAIKNAMKDLDEVSLLKEMENVMTEGGDKAFEALDACRAGMEGVGDLFEEGEYFVGDLIYAGEIMTSAVDIIKPALTKGNEGKNGKVLICTVKDDMHDIGKNIVKALLEAGGFEVVDLGMNVEPMTIVEACKNQGISIVALSGVLTLALDSMKATVEAFQEAGMRDRVKIVVGGACLSENAFPNIGADAWSSNPQKTVDICRGWLNA